MFVLFEKDNLLGLYPSDLLLRDPPFWGLSNHLLLIECIHIRKYGPRLSIPTWAFVPTKGNKNITKLITYYILMGKDFYENWGSLRKIIEKFHIVKSHDSHSNQMCGENKSKKEKP